MAPAKDVPHIPLVVRKVANTEAARALPKGSIVGDLHGGLTFSDAVAAVLEFRSPVGWQEVQIEGDSWTVIVLGR